MQTESYDRSGAYDVRQATLLPQSIKRRGFSFITWISFVSVKFAIKYSVVKQSSHSDRLSAFAEIISSINQNKTGSGITQCSD
jgi:hypothetical protein